MRRTALLAFPPAQLLRSGATRSVSSLSLARPVSSSLLPALTATHSPPRSVPARATKRTLADDPAAADRLRKFLGGEGEKKPDEVKPAGSVETVSATTSEVPSAAASVPETAGDILEPGPKPHPIDAFFDVGRVQAHTGNSWPTEVLRLKSFEDLHALYFVLLRERNKLINEVARARKAMSGTRTPSPERLKKVRVSIARLLTVVNERRRLRRMEALEAEADLVEDIEEKLGKAAEQRARAVRALDQRQKREQQQRISSSKSAVPSDSA